MQYQPPKTVCMKNQSAGKGSPSLPEGVSSDRYVHYTGRSMYPTFHDPEFLVLDKPEYNSLKRGDIIVFKDKKMDSMVIHRIVGKGSAGFITRGDNNPQIDLDCVTSDAYFGRAVGIVRKHGTDSVQNGLVGYLVSKIYLTNRFIKNKVLAPLFWNPITRRFFRFMNKFYAIHPSLILFKQKNGTVRVNVVIKNKTIGWVRNTDNHLVMKRRFRPFVNREDLIHRIEKLIDQELNSPPSATHLTKDSDNE